MGCSKQPILPGETVPYCGSPLPFLSCGACFPPGVLLRFLEKVYMLLLTWLTLSFSVNLVKAGQT